MRLARAYPGNPYRWWLAVAASGHHDQLIATALAVLEEK